MADRRSCQLGVASAGLAEAGAEGGGGDGSHGVWLDVCCASSAAAAGFSSFGSRRYFCFSDYGNELVAGCPLGLVAVSAPPPLVSMARVQK
jgi:hypothetical protein